MTKNRRALQFPRFVVSHDLEGGSSRHATGHGLGSLLRAAARLRHLPIAGDQPLPLNHEVYTRKVVRIVIAASPRLENEVRGAHAALHDAGGRVARRPCLKGGAAFDPLQTLGRSASRSTMR